VYSCTVVYCTNASGCPDTALQVRDLVPGYGSCSSHFTGENEAQAFVVSLPLPLPLTPYWSRCLSIMDSPPSLWRQTPAILPALPLFPILLKPSSVDPEGLEVLF
jgi:hypothetical protein